MPQCDLRALLLLGLCACAGAGTARPAPRTPIAQVRAHEAQVAAPVAAVRAPTPVASVTLADEVEAGTIPRPTLRGVLSGGVGRFLQHLRAEPRLEQGRFIGWRLLALSDRDPALSGGVLQVGDTVMRINGQSIERPEQFLQVWDSLATERDLVLKVERGGKQSQVHFRIVD